MAGLFALSMGAPSSTTPQDLASVGSIAAELARILPGTWRLEAVLPGGGTRPIGKGAFSPAFRSGVLLTWEQRNVSSALHSRGFLGARDSTASVLFYMAIAPNAPPIALTGHPDEQTRTFAWSLKPEVGADHPYNRGLVVSRLDLLGPTAVDWVAPGHWHIQFRT
ncbi:MAG: hypothetical protein IPF98_13475 [Gemmatimonadetes bacterium]|nr:hypothetical protein [Gemmatimonadota bacterium]